MSEVRPIRLAVLGGESTGKTSLVSRLTLNIVHEVHYPTRSQTNWLFEFIPHSKLAKTILDGQAHERLLTRTPGSEKLEPIFKSPAVTPYVLLSPLTFQAFTDNYTNLKNTPKSRITSNNVVKKKHDNQFYSYLQNDPKNESNNNSDLNISPKYRYNKNVLPRNYIPPAYSPIPIDIIDTSGFKPEMVVPFLEVSLYRNLDRSVLKGLANQPRQPVSTTSLLVASGASELNGKIDGYILVYSAIPELSHHSIPDPPAYSDGIVENDHNDESKSNNDKKDENDIPIGGGLSLLPIIRSCIVDAWTEFRNYETGWKLGQENDVYSLVHSLKNIWKSQESEQAKLAKMNKLRTFKTKLESINLDPASPDSPPPCLIVCTHINDPTASPVLINYGKKLATQWDSGFVGVDNLDNINVDVALSSIIKDIVEKDKLQFGYDENNPESHSHFQHNNRRKSASEASGSGGGMFKKIMKS